MDIIKQLNIQISVISIIMCMVFLDPTHFHNNIMKLFKQARPNETFWPIQIRPIHTFIQY